MAELIFIPNNDLYDLYYLQEGLSYGSININWPLIDGREVRLASLINQGVSECLGQIKKDWINDRPDLEIIQITEYTDGAQQRLEWTFKIKTKPFTKSMNYIDELNKSGFAVTLKREVKGIGNLKRVAKRAKSFKVSDSTHVSSGIDLSALFSYDPVIDLHAEALGIKTKGLSNGEIVNRQLYELKKWLENGIRHNISPLRVIHGIGKGMLRSRVQSLLAKHPGVSRFQNDYHPRYGHGSTEITLR